MDLIVKKLVWHKYSLEDLHSNCSPDTLKDTNLEWNEEEHKNHPYAKDIADNDIVFSVKWCEKEEEYAYFFFKKEVKEKVTLYTFEKAVIDINIPFGYLKEILRSIITQLNNGNYLDIDRLFYNNEYYPLVNYQLDNTVSKITQNFLQRFQSEKNGITLLPQSFLNKINAPE